MDKMVIQLNIMWHCNKPSHIISCDVFGS